MGTWIRRAVMPSGPASTLARMLAMVVVLAVAGLGVVAPLTLPAGRAYADATQVSVDAARTGWDRTQTRLTPGDVASADFGQQYATQLDGQIYAQPIVADGTLVVVTEANRMYGLDPVSGAVRWSRSVGRAWPASAVGCGDLTPTIGITSTPVYDPAGRTVYAVAKVDDGPTVAQPSWWMHAFDPATGAERTGWPVRIQGAPSNDPARPFDAYRQHQRPGLLLMNGVVYAGFGAHCDVEPYRGYVVGVSTTRAAVASMWTTEVGAGSGAGIWHAGGGLVSDGEGRIFASTGNGVVPAPGPGSSRPTTLGNSVFRLQVDPASGAMSIADFFTPSDAAALNANDTDFGSGSPSALPPVFGAGTATPRLLFMMGKDGRAYLLNRDTMGGMAQGPGGTDRVVSMSGPFEGLWGRPAVWGGDGGYLYVVGNSGPMRALKYGVSGAGVPVLSQAGTSPYWFPYTSGSPTVTSDGTTSGTAVVWVVSADGPTGANGMLRAYDAVPEGGTMRQLWSAPIGTAAKFTGVATDDNRVYVGTRDGRVYGFGRPASTPLTGTGPAFPATRVGASSTATATLTATRALTVTTVTATGPFTVGTTRPALPARLATGATLAVPVTFRPTDPGAASGLLTLTLADGTRASVGLSGQATRPGLSAAPSPLEFEQVATGMTHTLNVRLTNTGTATETVTAARGPAAPYTATGLPAVGASIAPGATTVVSVRYAPTTAGTHDSSLAVSSRSGGVTRTASVPITGSAVSGQGHLVLSPATTNFGDVRLGSSATLEFEVSNSGNLPITITKAKAPASAFTSPTPLPEGMIISPDQVVKVKVRFTPTVEGNVNDTYLVTADDGQGAQYHRLVGTGVNPSGGTVVPAPGDQWSFNGAASGAAAPQITVTGPVAGTAGSAFARTAIPSAGLAASFTASLPEIGGDGVTFAILDAGRHDASALGVPGGGLGFSGLTGYAVVLGTFWESSTNSSNYVAIARGRGTGGDGLTFLAAAKAPGNLRTGSHAVNVTTTGDKISVSVNGVPVVSAPVTLPTSVLVGFTGGNGSSGGTQVVDDVAISSGSSLPPPPPSGTVPVPGDRWSFNGTADAGAAPDVRLTGTAASSAGSAFARDAVATEGLTASFTTALPATGGDGVTFALLDPARHEASALGASGGGLGFSGLTGYAVVLGTFWEPTTRSSSYVAIAEGPGTGADNLRLLAAVRTPSDLRTGTHPVTVRVRGGVLSVTVDGVELLSRAVPVTATARVGFTAASGATGGVQRLTGVTIAASG